MTMTDAREFKNEVGFEFGYHYVYVGIAPIDAVEAYVKIGFTRLPYQRMATIIKEAPARVRHFRMYQIGRRKLAREAEARILLRLSEYRSHGEWFRFNMSNPEHKSALWGAVKDAVERTTTQKARVFDFNSHDVDNFRRLANHGKERFRRHAHFWEAA